MDVVNWLETETYGWIVGIVGVALSIALATRILNGPQSTSKILLTWAAAGPLFLGGFFAGQLVGFPYASWALGLLGGVMGIILVQSVSVTRGASITLLSIVLVALSLIGIGTLA